MRFNSCCAKASKPPTTAARMPRADTSAKMSKAWEACSAAITQTKIRTQTSSAIFVSRPVSNGAVAMGASV